MKWLIPAKTFFLGEYIALSGGPALILTTAPCFKFSLHETPHLNGIHPESPAGIYWLGKDLSKGLTATDPYRGRGGLGASSAQFLAAYLADCYLQKTAPNVSEMLNGYWQVAWQGVGLRPSGYDVWAQSQSSVVYLNHQQKKQEVHDWPFAELSFILVHTAQKLATHHYLQKVRLSQDFSKLTSIVDAARLAFLNADCKAVIAAVNDYHQQLNAYNLVAKHTVTMINRLLADNDILAAKGCGAMGSDVILLLVCKDKKRSLMDKLQAQSFSILATEADLNKKLPLIANISDKRLEISA